MKDINMYTRGICKNTGGYKELKLGKAITVLEYKGNHKIIKNEENKSSANRMILKAIINGLNLLNK